MRLNSVDDSPRMTSYIKNELPTILRVAPIVAALKKFGKFTDNEVREALTWGSGPLVLVWHPGKGRLWDSNVDPQGNTITIELALQENYSDFRSRWDNRTTPAERDDLVREMKNKIEWIPHRTYTAATSTYALTFFENKYGKRIWALGAVLLESLVRLGARRTMSDDEAARQSTDFQKAIYGKAVVDSARSRLGMIYHLIQTGGWGPIDRRWYEGAKGSF